MNTKTFEIRLCDGCGLRYPAIKDQTFRERCPVCLGITRLILKRDLHTKPEAAPPPTLTPTPGKMEKKQVDALLDNIRSAWNVGAIFRTADALGLRKLHICGITPTPENDAVRKISLGAEHTVAWNYSKNALVTAHRLKEKGTHLLALEQDSRSVSLNEAKISHPNNIVMIVGNEITGVDPALLDMCDQIVHIPMQGTKRSLNVEVAFAIAAYNLFARG